MTLEELLNILAKENPSDEIRKQEQQLFTLIPELELCKGFNANISAKSKDSFDNILDIIDNSPNNIIVRLSVLFMDIGKTISYKNREKNKKYWQVSEEIFTNFSERNNIDTKTKNTVLKTMHYHELNINMLNDDNLQKLTTIFTKEELILLLQLQRAITASQKYKSNSLIEKHRQQELKLLSKYK